ncbi:hypothetical protein MHU86_18282 [Fragilaria crotonensis]|nr:hypothetical protein MHU86_18282 [Fragilaria crotonensis]
MDAVIARTVRIPRRRTGKEVVDTPVKLRVMPEFLDAKYDKRYRCLVVVLPEAGVYYCHREKRHESVGVPNTHIPMDMNWLRIVRNGSRINRFAKGGYVSRLWDGNVDKIWKWRISRGSSNFLLDSDAMGITSRLLPFPKAMKKVMYARQCPDEEGPRLAPDHVEGQDYAMVEGVIFAGHTTLVWRRPFGETWLSTLRLWISAPGHQHTRESCDRSLRW